MSARHSRVMARAALAAVLLVGAAAIGQYALDAALDANTMVGGTGYNPRGRGGGSAASLRASSYRLNRTSGQIRDVYGGNSAFSRPEYRVGLDGGGGRAAVARAGLTRDQAYPIPATTNLRADDVQRRLQGGAYAPDDRRGRTGGLQSPVYKPHAATSYANPGAVNAGPKYATGSTIPGLQSAANRVPTGYGGGLAAPAYRPR